LASVPTFQVTTPAERVPPPVAETNEVPAGSGSLMTTPVAAVGPALVTDRV
jgi:hypothetical protein